MPVNKWPFCTYLLTSGTSHQNEVLYDAITLMRFRLHKKEINRRIEEIIVLFSIYIYMYPFNFLSIHFFLFVIVIKK